MPAHCSVVNCSDKYVHSGSISFHRFPFKRKDLLQKWTDFTQRSAKWMPSKWSAICSRHFVDSDFNCCNNRKTLRKTAVPSIRVGGPLEHAESLNVVVEQVISNAAATLWQHVNNKEQTLSSAAEPPPSLNNNNSGTTTKSTCRFCGNAAFNCVSFDNSFEVFGMIQKCFPTLQILQDDTLPKDICTECYKQLERFSQFIDVVMVAQSELQRKCRRQLKIKQEPFVRVKQEACESLDNLFPDELDIDIEHDVGQGASGDETEQKFQFCDFPMLNAQDIINNCDIMEIINLDDQFINITDDADGGGGGGNGGGGGQSTRDPSNELLPVLPSTQEILNEEHNYAKEDWQPQQQYKTEKIENNEQPPTTNRSSKPIVTNVSQIPTSMPILLPPPAAASKPNIVVLNDSVVQSSAAFHLHNCTICMAKFFTMESLNQHFEHTHAVPPPPPPVPPAPLGINLKLEGNNLPLASTTEYWQPPEWQPPQQQLVLPKRKIDILDMQRSFLVPQQQHQQQPPIEPVTSACHHPPPTTVAEPQLAAITANYAKLASRYRRLQRKCHQLRQKRSKMKAKRRFACRQCPMRFASVFQLLRHRQQQRHFVSKHRNFDAKCCGCFKLFRSRLGLRQHMRFICQSLPLRNTRLQSFKCRQCQTITFTHWRIYRRHELKCRQKKAAVSPPLPPPPPTKRRRSGGNRNAICNICQKSFSSQTGLRQHRITHTTERRYKCNMCGRVFKRRNGLSQHIKGFHLQLKPHECPVCQHRYALKCDMLRCRHSQRRV